jgi:carbamoyltransferase
VTKILGISAFYHDSAACLLNDGEIISAVQEERFTRIKHDSQFPSKSIEYILDSSKIKLDDLDYIVFHEKPFLKFERLLETYVAFAPRGFRQFAIAVPKWLKDNLFQKKKILECLKKIDKNFNKINKIHFSEHHLSHAASAFYPSPFKEAIILTADGVGEWATTTVAIGNNEKLDIIKEINFPHSLGLLYSSFTYYCGFKVNSGEYKLMGLAPYGDPKYKEIIKKELIDIKNDGSFHLNQKYFNYATGLTMTNSNFDSLFGKGPRNTDKENINQFHMDIAASIQNVTEEIIIKIVKSLKEEYKIDNLCMAGGVALNCVVNGKIMKEKVFNNVWIQPASGDAGGSLGAALALWHLDLKKKRTIEDHDKMQGSFLGPEYSQEFIEKSLIEIGANFIVMSDEEVLEKTVNDLINSDTIGWFQGRMEFGPRALGSRSIIGDPRSENMQKNLNLKVKFRESFRPFAPSILLSDISEWFKFSNESPYMLFVAELKDKLKIKMTDIQKKKFGIEKLKIKRSIIPAVTHVDYSSRIQTIKESTNKKFFKLLKKFKSKTGCPILINTSFNVRGEPIVNTPKDAFNCFMGTNLDKLVIGNCYLEKKKQKKNLLKNYQNKYELD